MRTKWSNICEAVSIVSSTCFFPNKGEFPILLWQVEIAKTSWHHTLSAFSPFPLLCVELEVEGLGLVISTPLILFSPLAPEV